MDATTARGVRRVLFATVVSALPLIAVQVASAQDELAPAKAAITQLKQLPGAVQQVMTVVRATNFGPFEISGSCGFDRQWYCFGQPCKTFNWSWKFPNYTWLKDALAGRYNNIATIGGQFDGHFAPVKTWLTVTLPDFVNHFDAVSKDMLAEETTYSNVASTPEQKDAATKAIQAHFNDLGARLDSGSEQLRAGVVSLSNYNNQLNSAIGQVTGLRNNMTQMLVNDTTHMNNTVDGWPCDADDARNQYNGIKNTVNTQFDRVLTSAQQYGVQSADTDRAVSVILGTVVNFRSRYQGIQQNLQAARVTPAGAVQALRLQVTINTWRDFANFARQQLQ
jgi:hypothetical protein